jgi:hypothetical protein
MGYRRGMPGALLGLILALATAPAAPLANSLEDGSLTLPNHPFSRWEPAALRFDFHLPQTAPKNRGRVQEPRPLPTVETVWEQDSIRYTQTLLATRWQPGPLWAPTNVPPRDALLFVRLAGENFGSDYTNASVSLRCHLRGQSLPLALHSNLVFTAWQGHTQLVAVLDITSGTIITTNAGSLQFSGHMPPGTTGALGIKLPLFPVAETQAFTQLGFLDFEEERERAGRHQAEPTVLIGMGKKKP